MKPLWGVNHTVTMYAPIGGNIKGVGGSIWRFLATWGRRGGVWGTIRAEGHPAAEPEDGLREKAGELQAPLLLAVYNRHVGLVSCA